MGAPEPRAPVFSLVMPAPEGEVGSQTRQSEQTLFTVPGGLYWGSCSSWHHCTLFCMHTHSSMGGGGRSREPDVGLDPRTPSL